ncbi:MAG: DUF192 domain-containing protein [Planctomycetaceae bacterium]|nr:MAG: DUF192 domain-containing protein [Planctomycetaceae bacterium]
MAADHQLRDAQTGQVLVARLERATTFWQRLRGLMFRRPLQPGEGLLIVPCRSIHTHWLRTAIDVVLMDRDGVVLSVHPNVRPWRMVHGTKDTHAVLETAGGHLPESVQVGRRLCVTSHADDSRRR